MSAIIDNLWKINVQLPHVVPNRYVSPPVTATATALLSLSFYEDMVSYLFVSVL